MKFILLEISFIYDYWISCFEIESGDFNGALFFFYYSETNGFDFDFLYIRGIYRFLQYKRGLK